MERCAERADYATSTATGWRPRARCSSLHAAVPCVSITSEYVCDFVCIPPYAYVYYEGIYLYIHDDDANGWCLCRLQAKTRAKAHRREGRRCRSVFCCCSEREMLCTATTQQIALAFGGGGNLISQQPLAYTKVRPTMRAMDARNDRDRDTRVE